MPDITRTEGIYLIPIHTKRQIHVETFYKLILKRNKNRIFSALKTCFE